MSLSRRRLDARAAACWLGTGLILVCAGCEPATLTEARDQIGRGPDHVVALALPLASKTLTADDFLGQDVVTTPDGLVGVAFDPESLRVAIGPLLQFSNVTSVRSTYDVPAAAFALPPGTVVPFATSYAALALEPRLQAIDTVVAAGGSLVITTYNRLPVTLSYTVTLNGFRGPGGTPLTRTDFVTAAPGNGAYTSSVITFDLTNVTITPATVVADLSGSFTVPATPMSPVLADSTVIQSGNGSIVVESLKGSLDPVQTPELTVAVSDSQAIAAGDFDFGDFQDAVRQATLNDARVVLKLRNTADAPLTLSNFTLGAVELTPGGQVPRDGSGNIVYQMDAQGPITIPVTDSGATTLTVARKDTAKTVTLQSARLLDRLVDLAIDGKKAAVVGSGDVVVGDGQVSVITRNDTVVVRMDLTVALDISLPATGVAISRVRSTDGAGFNDADIDQVAARIDTATATAIVTNGTPFRVLARIAVVAGTLSSSATVDSIFANPNRVELKPDTIVGGTTDATGRVTQARVDTVVVSLTGQQMRVLLGATITAGIRITLIPSSGGPRGALRASDQVTVRASAAAKIRSGGS